MATYIDSRKVSVSAEWIWSLHGPSNVSGFQLFCEEISSHTIEQGNHASRLSPSQAL